LTYPEPGNNLRGGSHAPSNENVDPAIIRQGEA